MSTLTWRSLDLLSEKSALDGGIRIQIVAGFLAVPEFRGIDVVVPSRAGRDPGNRVGDTLKVLLAGNVRGVDMDTWRTYTDLLMATFDEEDEDPGELIAGDGYQGLPAGQVATLTARVKNYIPGPILAGGTLQTWSIELESVTPRWAIGS